MAKTRRKYQEKTDNGLTKGFVMQQIQKQTTQKESSSTKRQYKRNRNWKTYVSI